MLSLNRIFPAVRIVAGLIALSACGSSDSGSNTGFTYTSIPIARQSVATGQGSSVNFRGTSLELLGNPLKVGEPLRNANVAQGDLSLLNIAETKGKVRIISLVPSLDTKVCEQQTHYLSEKNQGLDTTMALYTVSVDTPFAQDRFAKEAGIQNITFLSDYRGGEFGKTHGLLLSGPHLLARAVLVVDEQNVIRYLQVTPDLGNMPDMEAAFAAARALSKS